METKKDAFKRTMVSQLENDVLHNCIYLESGINSIEIITLENGIKVTVYYRNTQIKKIVIQ